MEMNVSNVKASAVPNLETVHGIVVGKLSPVKTSKKKNSGVQYFDGRYADEKKVVRLVSFDLTVRNKLDNMRESGGGVVLQNCVVKRNNNNNFELHINKKTAVVSSPKKFKMGEDMVRNDVVSDCAEVGTLEEVKELEENELICFTGKITSLSNTELVKKGSGETFKKRDFVIADTTSSCRGVAWEQLVDVMTAAIKHPMQE